jgi:hypothetical protein
MAELRTQIAELSYAGRACCTRRAAWHVPYSVVLICICGVFGTTTCHAMQRMSICHAAPQLPCQLALLRLAARAQRAHATQH